MSYVTHRFGTLALAGFALSLCAPITAAPVATSARACDAAPTPAAAPHVIPFQYHSATSPAPVIQIRINGGKPIRVVVDTGAPPILSLTEAAAAELGLPVAEAEPIRTSGLDGKRVPVRSIGLVTKGQAEPAPVLINECFVTKLEGLQPAFAQPVAGILGLPALAEQPVQFDYQRGELLWYPKGARVPASSRATRVPLEHTGTRVIVSLTAPTGKTLPFIVDTGATTTTIKRAWMDEFRPRAVHMDSYGGLYGSRETWRLLVPSLRLGTRTERDLSLQGDERKEGLLGNDLLARFRVTLDVPGRALILDPAEDYAARVTLPAENLLALSQEGDTYVIAGVAPDLQAMPALQPGDRVDEVDGYPLKGLSVVVVGNLLHGAAGATARVTVRRGEEVIRSSYRRPGAYDYLSDPEAALLGVRNVTLDQSGVPFVDAMRCGSLAWNAGLRPGDRILKIDSVTLESRTPEAIGEALARFKEGGFTARVRRGAQELDIPIPRLDAARPTREEAAEAALAKEG